jgi:hypothetical protein
LAFVDHGLRDAIDLCGPAPAHSSHFESSVPGLYFVGASSATTFGPVTRFVAGATFSARRVARHAARPGGAPASAPDPGSERAASAPEPTS